MSDHILVATDVAFLCNEREHLPKKVYLTLVGSVTALSELIRVKNSDLFIIEVDRCINILVKDFHLDWHSQLQPKETYIFYNLRLTTLNKGISTPCAVLLDWRSSSFTRLSFKQNIKAITLQEWLKLQKITNLSVGDYHPNPVECEDLINYEGTVTGTEEASNGVFILDDKLQLYVSAISLFCNVGTIKKHCHITVSNAHMFKDTVFIVCCLRSLIRIKEAAPSLDVETVDKRDLDDPGTHIFMTYRLNMEELIATVQLRNKLMKLKRPGLDLTRAVCYILDSLVCQEEAVRHGNLLEQFIYHSEHCPFFTLKAEKCRIAQSVNISDIKNDNSEAYQERHSRNSSTTDDQYSVITCENKILIGQLTTLSGQTVLKDDTGHLPAVVLFDPTGSICDKEIKKDDPAEKDDWNHHCCQCCLDNLHPGTHPFCHILDPAMLGRTVFVRRFHIIVNYGKMSASSSVITNCDELSLYIAFEVLDCIILDRMLTILSADACAVTKPMESCSDVCLRPSSRAHAEETENPSDKASCSVYVTQKQSLTNSETQSNGSRVTQFMIVGIKLCAIHKGVILPKCNSEKCKATQSAAIRQSYTLKKRHHMLVSQNSDNNDLGLYRKTEEQDQHCSTPESKKKMTPKDLSKIGQDFAGLSTITTNKKVDSKMFDTTKSQTNMAFFAGCERVLLKDKCRLVSLSFSKSACRWYSFISPGQTYKLTACRDSVGTYYFEPHFSDTRLQRAAEKSGMRIHLQTPENMLVERVQVSPPEVCVDTSCDSVMYLISQILCDSFSEPIVSFQGVIISRNEIASSLVPPKGGIADVKSYSVTHLQLEVREQIVEGNGRSSYGQRGFSVYVDVPRMCFMLGIIPGSIVNFYRLERKVSRNGKIYCRFTTVSSAHVVRFLEHEAITRLKALQPQIQDHLVGKNELLINIWQKTMKEAAALEKHLCWNILCHIYMLLRLSIKALCPLCKGIYRKQMCQNSKCGNYAPPIAQANATVLVEDGTCQAQVKIWDADLVRRFLTLTTKQWEEVVTTISAEGEILISRFTPLVVSPIAEFLDMLTKSSQVLRPCIMVVRSSKNFPSSQALDEKYIEDVQIKPVKVGNVVLNTLSPSMLQLDCQSLAEWD